MRSAFLWRSAWTGMWRCLGLTLASLTTLSVGLWLMGCLAVGATSARALAAAWIEEGHLTAGLAAELSADAQEQVRARAAALPGVLRATLVSPEEQLAWLSAESAAIDLEGIDAHLLPASLQVVPTVQAVQAGALPALATQLAAVPGTVDVAAGAAPLVQLHRAVRGVTLACAAAAVGLSLALVFMVNNTIRLMLFHRRDELRIQKLIGATDLFVQAPFWLEGLLWGVAAGAVAALAMLACAHFGREPLARLASLLDTPVPNVAPPALLGLQVSLGGAIGLIGSTLASRAFLRDDAARIT